MAPKSIENVVIAGDDRFENFNIASQARTAFGERIDVAELNSLDPEAVVSKIHGDATVMIVKATVGNNDDGLTIAEAARIIGARVALFNTANLKSGNEVRLPRLALDPELGLGIPLVGIEDEELRYGTLAAWLEGIRREVQAAAATETVTETA